MNSFGDFPIGDKSNAIDFLKGLLHYFYAVTSFIECFMHWSLTNYATYLIITVLYSTVIWREKFETL